MIFYHHRALCHYLSPSPESFQPQNFHYTVLVILQYRYPPAEFSRSHNSAVSGGLMCFVWQAVQKLHVNTAVPWAGLGIHASHASHDDCRTEISGSLQPTSPENTRMLHYGSLFADFFFFFLGKAFCIVSYLKCCTQQQLQTLHSDHMQTETRTSTRSCTRWLVMPVTSFNYCCCWTAGTLQSALQVKGGKSGPWTHKHI